ncbi:kynureninase [Paractinoplanes brasiliensis]|uniref:Kynureninase n=1 Tax=Paractinoplanes brasiliensis TaxID=52695 RepID=A0A4V3C6A0_9ACTN|nr:kynureninase [Actinoplanes brasiliensis]TDO32918.1 kynureninase [Actinoplanes brasiliensis]GID28634.1 kynureninase [Actinoplanes brasiliensis]
MQRDQQDPGRRHLFHIPPAEGGDYPEVAYFAGNSLGLQPKATRVELNEDLDEWARLGVEGHLDAVRPWLPYHELLTRPAARLVGALPSEVVVMNSLTVDLHLLMVSFYRPAGERTRIVIEDAAFPSDSYAVRSQARFHGLDPDTTVVRLRPRDGEDTLRTEDVVAFLRDEGHTVALLMLGGVNYLTGELMDMATITAAGREAGAVVGWDLAHAAGNVPLSLHEWGADFAAWCSYKYLNSGPGALAGVFVHERHHGSDLPRFEGWWSTEAATRFEMTPESRPPRSADAWQVSNPPIFAMGPVRTSLRIFDEAGMPALRERSLRLTGYLRELLDEVVATRPLSIITPREPERHGCQLSVRLHEGNAGALTKRLRFEHGVIADARQPDIVRFAPVPLYSSYEDCRRAAEALAACVEETQ